MPFNPEPMLIFTPQRAALPEARMRRVRRNGDSDILRHCLKKLVVRMMMEARWIRQYETLNLFKEVL